MTENKENKTEFVAHVCPEDIFAIQKRILQGDFLNESYLSQFIPVNSTNTLKRFCLYKSNAEKAWRGEDCDSTLAAVVTYSLMYADWLDCDSIQWQPENECKFCIKSKQIDGYSNLYRGDAMTSAWTVFREYLYQLWKVEPVDSPFRKLFSKSRYRNTLATLNENDPYNFQSYFFKLIIHDPASLYIIDSKISPEAKAFLENYLNAGNFIAVPEGFNTSRSNGGQWDTVDRILWKIYQYFELSKNDTFYLYQLLNLEVFAEKYTENEWSQLTYNRKQAKNYADKIVKNCIDWFNDAKINSWQDFVEKHMLEPFVDKENEWKPISLKTGGIIEEKDLIRTKDTEKTGDYNPMPSTISECETFFKTVNKGIKERNKLIWERCKENYAKK